MEILRKKKFATDKFQSSPGRSKLNNSLRLFIFCNPEGENLKYAEDEAEDVGKVLRLNARCEDSEGNDSEECMVMKEWTALEPGNVEHKHYFPGVGLVYIKELKGKTVEVELIDINDNPIPNLHTPSCP